MIQPSGHCPATIMIVGEAPGEQEVLKGEPFVGMSGQELSKMLHEAGIMRSACFITNVVRVRPKGNDITTFIAMKKKDVTPSHKPVRDKMCLQPVVDGMELLKREIELCGPHVIIAFGNVSMWALTGEWGITSWRGSTLECDLPLALPYRPKVIPVYHPSAILRQWEWRPIAVHDLKKAKVESRSQEIKRPDYRFIIRPNFNEVERVLACIVATVQDHPTDLSVDIETRAGHIACIGLAWSRLESICIPLMCVERPEGYWLEEEEAKIMFFLYRILTHKNCRVIGQNFLYDAQYFWRWCMFLPNLMIDTMLLQHTMFSNMPKGLDFLSSMYCGYHIYWKEEGKTWNASTGEEQLWEYNCKDAVITFEVAEEEAKACTGMSKNWTKLPDIVNFQQKLFWPVLETMNKGLRVDTKARGEIALKLSQALADCEAYFLDVLGHPLNPRSGPQMKGLFYDDLKQKPILNRKTGAVSCDDESLRKIGEREPLLRPLIQRIQDYRSLGVFLSTFITASLDTDGRMRCSFNIGGTETYRFSSSQNAFGSGMNLQNIPKGGETTGAALPNVRNLFIPDEGKTFFDIDLSSADLRIVVWESDEQEMKAMLREGLDPYTEIAKEFYHDPSITKKDSRRQTFKSFAHGTNYLGTAKGLAERLGLSVHEADKTQKWYFQRFPRIRKWQENLINQVITRKMVENVFGYRCYFFGRIEGTIFNEAAAWIPQSTVACLINRAYLNIHNNLPEVEVLLQVHDSLAGQFPTASTEQHTAAILQQSEITLPYADPLTIPVGIKTSTKSWGDCE